MLVTGRARGGNDIHLRFNGRNTSLHSIWDGLLITKLQHTLNPPRVQYDQILTYLLEELQGRHLNSTARWLGCPYPATSQDQLVLNAGPGGFVAQKGCVESWMEETHQLNCAGVWSFDTPDVKREQLVVDRNLLKAFWLRLYGVEEAHEEMYGEYFDIDLSEGDYWEWVLQEHIIQIMLIRGGVRLAGILNGIFDN